MKIFILGANGFIGHHLTEAILTKTDWQLSAMDRVNDKLQSFSSHPRFQFHLKDMIAEKDWVKEQINNADVILPLAAIATPATYVQQPLKIFELDFEANLQIVRDCVHFGKRLIFPSTSEVYGMCTDAEFDEEDSHLVTGPIHKTRWIYSASKQLLDRVIYAYGQQEGLSYTLFRPFNWYGPGLDSLPQSKAGGARVITQFIGNILRGENIQLVNGGTQQRCFTFIDDGIAALLKIIENKTLATQKIFNIGNPQENVSIRALAEMLLELSEKKVSLIDVLPEAFYGEGYQDMSFRVPSIQRATKDLGWQPRTSLREGLKKTFQSYV